MQPDDRPTWESEGRAKARKALETLPAPRGRQASSSQKPSCGSHLVGSLDPPFCTSPRPELELEALKRQGTHSKPCRRGPGTDTVPSPQGSNSSRETKVGTKREMAQSHSLRREPATPGPPDASAGHPWRQPGLCMRRASPPPNPHHSCLSWLVPTPLRA